MSQHPFRIPGLDLGLRALSLARRAARTLFWPAAIGLFTYAALLRFRLPLEPIFDLDTYDYMSSPVGKLIGWGFFHYRRNYSYPGFLLLVLGTFRDVRAIVVVQHLFGLAAGGIFLLAWERLRGFLPDGTWPASWHRSIGLGAAAIYLTAAEPIRFEMMVRPEGIASFLVILNILLALEFSYRCYVRPAKALPVALGIGSVATSLFVMLTKPSLYLATGVTLAPIIAALFCSFSRKSKLALGIGSVAVGLLLILPAQLPARSDPESITFVPRHLFMMHADVMRDQIASDLSDPAPTKYPKDFLERVHRILATEINKSPTNRFWPVLGFNPNYLMYSGKASPPCANLQILAELGDRIEDLCRFYYYYYERAWRKRPGAMAGKIGRHMLLFYAPKCRVYSPEPSRSLLADYKMTVIRAAHLRSALPGYEPLLRTDFVSRISGLAQSEVRIWTPRLAWYGQVFLARAFAPTLGLTAIVLMLIVFNRRLRERLGGLAIVTGSLCAYNLAATLVIAVMHSIDQTRYVTIQLIFALMAQFTAFLLIGQSALEIVRLQASSPFPDSNGGTATRRSQE